MKRFLPILEWAPRYRLVDLRADLVAGVIVLFITIPQVIAYAFLAGAPAETGLYAAILALLSYAAFGSSRALAVGPTAIIAMMTLEAVSHFAMPQTAEYLAVMVKLAMITGGLLIVLRILNFGAVISFLSHAVVTGFITAAAILIISNQIPSLLGLPAANGTALTDIGMHLYASVGAVNTVVLALSTGAILLLVICRTWLAGWLRRLGLAEGIAASIARAAPMFVVILGTAAVAIGNLDKTAGVAVVGSIPTALPSLTWVSITISDLRELLPSALLIAMVVFLESTSVGTAVASKRREKINPNQELIGLGMANVGSALAGGFPVAGSFARTIVNFSSGAVSQVASLFTALLVILTLVFFAALFYFLPKAALSAIIVISAAQLIEVGAIRKIFAFNPIDAVTFSFTFLAVLSLGVEMGILVGIVISFVLLIRASSKPHIAVVGRWKNTEHFRNVERYEGIETHPGILAVRIDESFYFVNTRYIETFLLNKVAESPEIEHVLLICTAANFIDSSGLEMLELLSDNLSEAGVTLHLSEVKGPVMDRLRQTDFFEHMHGNVYFTTDIAMKDLARL